MAVIMAIGGEEVMSAEELAAWLQDQLGARRAGASFVDQLRREVAQRRGLSNFRQLRILSASGASTSGSWDAVGPFSVIVRLVEVMDCLLQLGANMHQKDRYGYTPEEELQNTKCFALHLNFGNEDVGSWLRVSLLAPKKLQPALAWLARQASAQRELTAKELLAASKCSWPSLARLLQVLQYCGYIHPL
ncbi:unnamed protein product [Effrenium voratum]|uniref:Uncharacterized protein n=1 Tax=Effrenium voratum TaxID=2562239 RepID=A0AA36IZB4_9DINO|nr:unnamed protein product [Effrenium voratum]